MARQEEEESKKNIWPKTISVDKRIVKILSASTYDNFPNALKEMITNAYDADSREVSITVDEKNESITIEDDGVGMTEEEFGLYLRIAGVKREKKKTTSSGRHVIGQFGVGFLAVFPFFRTFQIETKKARDEEILKAEIPCHLYFGQNTIDISEIKVQGGISYDKSKFTRQYTVIKLKGFTPLSKAFFKPALKAKPREGSILNKKGLEVLKWRLSEDLPLRFENANFNKLFDKYSPNLPFNVKFNKEPLIRKTYGKQILEIHRGEYKQIGKIKFRFFIVNNNATIDNPVEARHMKIRNLNVGVGERTAFGLGAEVGGARSRTHWLSGEVHIIDGMNDLITVARDKFNYDTDYEELKDFFIKRLSFHSTQLEEEIAIEKFVQNSRDNSTIKNIKLLDPKKLNRKLTKIGKSAEDKKYVEDIIETPVADRTKVLKKEDFADFEKKITIEGKTYKVQLDSWSYTSDFYPACKIEGNILYINNRYPLFKGTKHTDIFIKLHVFLLNRLNNKIISRVAYESMARDVIKLYKDYF